MKKALVIGSEGQDGRLLKQLLGSKQYEVFGIGRTAAKGEGLVGYLQVDLSGDDFAPIEAFIALEKPAEIYFVAAFHQSSQEESSTGFDYAFNYVMVNQLAFIRVLEICRIHHPSARIVYTSSSLVYAGSGVEVQNERTPPAPRCMYSLSKKAASDAAEFYRAHHSMFVSVAIMYNHESSLRSTKFLSKKIVDQARQWMNGELEKIIVADLSSSSDWGYALDYVEALWHILQLPAPDVYIVSSGTSHSVRDWFETLFKYLKKDWREIVKEDSAILIRRKPLLIGDNSKLLATGWRPRVSFEEMVIRMYQNTI